MHEPACCAPPLQRAGRVRQGGAAGDCAAADGGGWVGRRSGKGTAAVVGALPRGRADDVEEVGPRRGAARRGERGWRQRRWSFKLFKLLLCSILPSALSNQPLPLPPNPSRHPMQAGHDGGGVEARQRHPHHPAHGPRKGEVAQRGTARRGAESMPCLVEVVGLAPRHDEQKAVVNGWPSWQSCGAGAQRSAGCGAVPLP